MPVPQHLEAFLEKLSEIKAGFEIGNYGIRFYAKKSMRGADIDTSPHPGFMTDWQPLWAVLATQLKGESIIHETVYPSRFHYVPDLVHMGANITLFNPKVDNPDKTYNFNAAESQPGAFHAAKFHGPSKLSAGHFTVKDLRHGATLVLAGLAAKGITVLDTVEHIDRGYEDLDSRLRSMGAHISRQPLE
jgi:UDP-N-acetylglucosamine 1-carboxyvinyltransferase